MKNLFPNWVKQSARIAAKDKVYMIALAFMAVSAIMDLFTFFDTTGGLAFFCVILASAIFNIGYWKWRYKVKGTSEDPGI